MNLMELLYLMAALGAGAGLALAVGERHGFLPAVLAFVGGVVGVFALLALVISVANRCDAAKRRRRRDEGKESEQENA